CSARAQGSYTRILRCQGAELQLQEARLNAAYSALRRRSTNAQRRSLHASEIEWLNLRERKCQSSESHGHSDLVDSRECRLDETVRRIAWLNRHR
ncbi:lysozyme inhibitor LprI family protein, partial [Acinetobacter baumannii]